MSDSNSRWQKLATLRDEIKLQSHLLSLEVGDSWHRLEKRFTQLQSKFEKKLMDKVQHIGESEEHLLIGDQQEIQTLLHDYDQFRQQHIATDSDSGACDGPKR